MVAKCPHCGATNPDSLPFCNSCGNPIDRELQFYLDIQQATTQPPQQPPRKSRYDDDDDDDFFFDSDDDNSAEDRHPKIVLGAVISLCVAAVALAWLFLR